MTTLGDRVYPYIKHDKTGFKKLLSCPRSWTLNGQSQHLKVKFYKKTSVFNSLSAPRVSGTHPKEWVHRGGFSINWSHGSIPIFLSEAWTAHLCAKSSHSAPLQLVSPGDC